jgi:acyl-CoA thioesterase-1
MFGVPASWSRAFDEGLDMVHTLPLRSLAAAAGMILGLAGHAAAAETGPKAADVPAFDCASVPDPTDCLTMFSAAHALAGAVAKRVERPFPAHCAVLRRSLISGDLTRTAERVRQGKLRVLAIGSSSTAGFGTSSPKAAYPAKLEEELGFFVPGLAVTVVASGISGETADETLARLIAQVASLRPQLVIWQVGTNDALSESGEDQFRSLVERGVTAAVDSGADVVLLNQQFFPGITKPERYERFVEIVREVGLQHHASIFGRYELMKEWSDDSKKRLRDMLYDDAFHMNDRGHACLARILSDEIIDAAQRPSVSPEIQ